MQQLVRAVPATSVARRGVCFSALPRPRIAPCVSAFTTKQRAGRCGRDSVLLQHQQALTLGGAASRPGGRGSSSVVRAMASNGGVEVPPGSELAVLGGGCFWCIEAAYRMLRGVSRVESGYAGGHVANPTYEQVCGKQTGHAEVVAITYDPAVISYKDLLGVFFTLHDPTTPNRQGADVGPQYRSIILYTSDAQKAEAEEVMAQVTADKLYDAPLVTELVPLTKYWPGESYHQDYYANNPNQGYCRAVVAPKVAKFRSKYMSKLVA